MLAIAFIAQYMVSGTRWVEDRLPLQPPRWIAAGLLAAMATDAGASVFGYPFLTTHTTHTAHLTQPVIGELHLPSAALFDAGVFAVVRGATLLLTAVAHQSLCARTYQEPIVRASTLPTLETHADPLPQSLVLTAIVIGFATTALCLVVLMALRELSGGDHVDGQAERP